MAEKKRIIIVLTQPTDPTLFMVGTRLEENPYVSFEVTWVFRPRDYDWTLLREPPDILISAPFVGLLGSAHNMIRALRAEPKWQSVPVVVIGSSNVTQATDYPVSGADAFIPSYADLDGLLHDILGKIRTLTRPKI